jgi:hypothetical protein
LPPPPPAGASAIRSSNRKNAWTRFASAGIAAAALALIVLLSWPKSPEREQSELALNAPTNELADRSTFRKETERDQLEMPMAAGNAVPADAFNDARFRQDGQIASDKTLKMVEEQEGPQTAKAEAAGGFGGSNFERKPRFASEDDLKYVPAAQVVEALDQPGEQVAVVKLLVADRGQGLKNLQTLLQRHEIALANPGKSGPGRDSTTPAEQGTAKATAYFAVYVDANDDQLAAAMRDLQQDAAFAKLTMDAPVAVSQLEPALASAETVRMPEQRRNRMMQFGGGGTGLPKPGSSIPQVMRAAQSPKPDSEIPPVEAKKTAPPPPRPEPALPNPEPASNKPGEKTLPEKAPAPRIGVANSEPLPALADGIGETEKRDPEAKPKAAGSVAGDRNESAEKPSTQRELTLPSRDLDRLQKQLGDVKTKDEEKAGAKESSAGKRVLVLFVLVDPSTQSAVPAGQPAEKTPAAPDDNGGA